MINTDQIEEWIQEVSERPGSAPLIIRYISSRLKDLSGRNEELLADNIALRSDRKVEEYEARIANLEYQLDILKRQMGGVEFPINGAAKVEALSVVIFNARGQVLRVELPLTGLISGKIAAAFVKAHAADELPPRLLVTSPAEELLIVFDSGRTIALPVTELHAADPQSLDWSSAYLAEPRGAEELAAILPVGRMALYDCCVQASRRGCAKKMMRTSFEQHVAKNYVGTGVKQKPDRTCSLTLCDKDDQLVLASWEGYMVSLAVNDLSYTAEETLRLSATDHIASSFVPGKKPSLIIVTHNGKAIVREVGWLEKAGTAKSRGQAIFSQARRDAGVRVAGAAAVDENDWGIALDSRGRVTIYSMADLFANGALTPASGNDESADCVILEFTAFSAPSAKKA